MLWLCVQLHYKFNFSNICFNYGFKNVISWFQARSHNIYAFQALLIIFVLFFKTKYFFHNKLEMLEIGNAILEFLSMYVSGRTINQFIG